MAGDGDRDRPPARLEPSPALEKVGDDDLPVVTRLMIEIRSDGSRTVVRGRLDDHTREEPHSVEMEARAATPVELVKTLTRALVEVLKGGPVSLGSVVRGLLPGKKTKD